MKETNFKCMYLIDHNLYKKAIINNNNNSSHDYNTTYLSSEYLGSDTNLKSKEIKCQNNTCNSEMTNKYINLYPSKDTHDDFVEKQKDTDTNDVDVERKKDTDAHNVGVGQQKDIASHDVGSQKDYTNPYSRNKEEIPTTKISNKIKSDENCQCMEITSTNDQESTHKTGKVSRKRKYDEIYNKIDHSNAETTKPKKIKIKPASNENNYSDLKDRLNRIRNDIEWPPRKSKKHSTPNFKKPLKYSKLKQSININPGSNENDYSDLQDRLNRIRYDIDWPPRKPKKHSTPILEKPTKYSKLKQPININPKSNENDSSDLQDRLNRIRNDIEWPPRKSKNNSNQHMDNMDDFVKKSSHIKNGRENIIYICTLCNQNFKRKKSLSRHMKNIHADFFSNFESKKRKLPKVFHTPNKKFKTDISRKRKSESGIKSNKRVKKELLCKFCNSFFKNSSSLKRHEKNIHDFHNDNMKGLKRERNDDVGGYKKRHKNAEKSSVTYDNYF